MSRGNEKQRIFKDSTDFRRYLTLLERALLRFGTTCLAYCVMWNHVHLLLKAGEHPIARLLQQVNSAYCQGFNRRHRRVGHVVQGRYKGLLIDSDTYFLRALRYIMLNPLESKYVRRPEHWKWSSYAAIAGKQPPPAFLAANDVWITFDNDAKTAQEQFVTFIEAGAAAVAPTGPLVFGSQEFRRRVGRFVEPVRSCIDFSYAERTVARPTLMELFANVPDAESESRAICEAFLTHAYTLREVGQFLNKHPGTIWARVKGVRSRSSNVDSKIEI